MRPARHLARPATPRHGTLVLALLSAGCWGTAEESDEVRRAPGVSVGLVSGGDNLAGLAVHTRSRCQPLVEQHGACEAIHCRIETDCDARTLEVVVSDGATSATLRTDETDFKDLAPLDRAATLSVSSEDPPFAEEITVPDDPVVLDSPVDGAELDRGASLAVTWSTSEQQGTVNVSVMAEGGSYCPVVRCRFPAADGRGEVPRDALTVLGAPSVYDLWAEVERATATTSQGFDVRVSASLWGAASERRQVLVSR